MASFSLLCSIVLALAWYTNGFHSKPLLGFLVHQVPHHRHNNHHHKKSPCEKIGRWWPSTTSTAAATTTTTTSGISFESEEESDDDLGTADDNNVGFRAMPWSDVQDYTLRDALPRYTIRIPYHNKNSNNIRTYALWRTMINEITDLAGYEPSFLRWVYYHHQTTAPAKTPVEQEEENKMSLLILPMLDNFEFVLGGGLSGNVYGLSGVADGTAITTPPLTDVMTTVPRGYVRIDHGIDDNSIIAYELGQPASSSASSDNINQDPLNRQNMLRSIAMAATSISRTTTTTAAATAAAAASSLSKTTKEDIQKGNDLLLGIGTTTAIVLAGATAFSLLSHHLTVNVFWV